MDKASSCFPHYRVKFKKPMFSAKRLLGRAPGGFSVGCTVLGNDNDDQFHYLSYHHTQNSASYTQSWHAQKSDLIYKIIFFHCKISEHEFSAGGGEEEGPDGMGRDTDGHQKKKTTREAAAPFCSYQNCMHVIHLNPKVLDLKPKVSEGWKHKGAFLQSGHQKDPKINAKIAYNCSNLGFINFCDRLSAKQMPQQKRISKDMSIGVSWRYHRTARHQERWETNNSEKWKKHVGSWCWASLVAHEGPSIVLGWDKEVTWVQEEF